MMPKTVIEHDYFTIIMNLLSEISPLRLSSSCEEYINHNKQKQHLHYQKYRWQSGNFAKIFCYPSWLGGLDHLQ